VSIALTTRHGESVAPAARRRLVYSTLGEATIVYHMHGEAWGVHRTHGEATHGLSHPRQGDA